MTVDELLPQFPGRTFTSVRVHAKRLGLHHTREQFLKVLSKKTSGSKNGMYGRRGTRKGVALSAELRTKLSKIAREGYATGRRVGKSGAANPSFGKPSPMRGKVLPESAKKILSVKAAQRWTTRTPAYKNKHLTSMRLGWAKWALARKPTKIEILVGEWLTELGVDFEPQEVTGFYIVDFLVGNDAVVETHGDYWHGNPSKYVTLDHTQKANRRRDKAKKTWLQKQGFKLLVLWEADLKSSPDECRQCLREFVA